VERSTAGGDDGAVALKQAAAWTAAGYRVATAVTAGPGFWQTVEVEEAPDLVAASLDALEESCRG
jgi:hypothetical protein